MKNDINMKNRVEKEFGDDNIEQKILDYSAQLKVPFTLTNDEAWKRLQTMISTNTNVMEIPKGKRVTMLHYISSAAALLLAMFGIWQFVFRTPVKEVIALKGQHIECQLPDGSRVSLNADSKISFNKNKFNKSRNLSMEGEAFFSIQKGKTFTIKTELANIKILGTSFNVYARKHSFKVCCVTGKILVTSGNQSFTIHPGESAMVNNDVLSKTKEKNMKTVANWRNGDFNFENAPLKLVLNEIERQFNVTFVQLKVDNFVYTGGFTNKNLVDALESVCSPMGLTYEIGRNSQISIRKKTP
jgi:ferric-dicitrate binding protein FerR (iron transport regulator)